MCNAEAEFKHLKFIFHANEAIRMAFEKKIFYLMHRVHPRFGSVNHPQSPESRDFLCFWYTYRKEKGYLLSIEAL